MITINFAWIALDNQPKLCKFASGQLSVKTRLYIVKITQSTFSRHKTDLNSCPLTLTRLIFHAEICFGSKRILLLMLHKNQFSRSLQNLNFLTKNLVAQHNRQPVCLLPVGRNRSQRIGGNLNDNDFVKHVELGIYLFYYICKWASQQSHHARHDCS